VCCRFLHSYFLFFRLFTFYFVLFYRLSPTIHHFISLLLLFFIFATTTTSRAVTVSTRGRPTAFPVVPASFRSAIATTHECLSLRDFTPCSAALPAANCVRTVGVFDPKLSACNADTTTRVMGQPHIISESARLTLLLEYVARREKEFRKEFLQHKKRDASVLVAMRAIVQLRI